MLVRGQESDREMGGKEMKIVAEIGCNWNNREQAFKMMGMAKALGINLVKYQLFQKEDVPEEIKSMAIDEELAQSLVRVGRDHEQDVFFSCMYPEAVDICERIGVKYYKVRYFDRNNLPLYRKLKKTKNKLIFVSCQSPHDTIFYNMAKYQKRVRFLYCVPKYPAYMRDYEGFMIEYFRNNPELGLFPKRIHHGISDHIEHLGLFQAFKNEDVWFEMHMKVDDNCIESKWSKSFEELKTVLKNG